MHRKNRMITIPRITGKRARQMEINRHMGSHTIEYHADEGSSEIVFLRNVKVV